jgi:hypothetical protein
LPSGLQRLSPEKIEEIIRADIPAFSVHFRERFIDIGKRIAEEAQAVTRKQYIDCLREIHVPDHMDCEACKKKTIMEFVRNFQRMFHLKGWDD